MNLLEYRRAKDEYFGTDPHSPLDPHQREGFEGLNYYDENPALAIRVEPEVFDQPELVEMQTSTGSTARYLRWARVNFEVSGQPAALTVYRNPGTEDMFLPLRDATSGSETYGAGRYLDVQELPDGTLLLDFNYAYNPYCAYNDAWTCPLPPPENRLNVPIRAGEKNFREDAAA